jgi:hypothetical protein
LSVLHRYGSGAAVLVRAPHIVNVYTRSGPGSPISSMYCTQDDTCSEKRWPLSRHRNCFVLSSCFFGIFPPWYIEACCWPTVCTMYLATQQAIHPTSQRDCMKTPDRRRSGSPPSAENGHRGLYFGVWCYRRSTMEASPTTFHTVSPGTLMNRH